MNVEVVAAGIAADELRHDRDEGGEEDDGGSGEAGPADFVPRLHQRNLRCPTRLE